MTPKINFDKSQIRIAFTGKMRTGKDTLAKFIEVELNKEGYSIHSVSFGRALKEVAEYLFPEEFENSTKPRELYQWIGQTLRERNEDVWINKVADSINRDNTRKFMYSRVENPLTVHMITDLRQPNEYLFCKENNFHIIKVECDDRVRIQRMKTLSDDFKEEDLHHETEKYIDSFEADFKVDTTYTTEEELMHIAKDISKQIIKIERGNK